MIALPRPLVLAAAAFLAGLAACSSSKGPQRAKGTLLLTGDNWGEFAPCG